MLTYWNKKDVQLYGNIILKQMSYHNELRECKKCSYNSEERKLIATSPNKLSVESNSLLRSSNFAHCNVD